MDGKNRKFKKPKYWSEPHRKERKTKKNTELTDEERKLFDELIVPNMGDINNLVAYYSNSARDFDDNKSICLDEMACYIKSFQTSKIGKIRSWIHVCVKHCIERENKRRATSFAHQKSEVPIESYMDSTKNSPVADSSSWSELSLFDNISDEMYRALMKIPLEELRPFMLYAQGYSMSEIAEIEYNAGNIASKSVYIVRGRVSNAKIVLKKILTENGCRPKIY